MADMTEKLKERLTEQGSIGSLDIANFSTNEEATPLGDELNETTKVAVPEGQYDDPLNEILDDGAETSDELGLELKTTNPDNYTFGLKNLVEVEITPEEKEMFLDAIVDDSRFELAFSLFNGKVTGVFRSRTTGESRAILKETHRRWAEFEKMPGSEYSTILKGSMLRAQLKELNGTGYPEMTEPLLAQYDFETDKTVPPKWYNEMETLCNKFSDALITALYGALQTFEDKYWTLIKHAGDQDFWLPEDSI